MTIELNSEALVKAFGLNRTIVSARINPGAGTPVLLDQLGVKSVTRDAAGIFTVTFMFAFRSAPIFIGTGENPTDANYSFVVLDNYNAAFTTAQVKLFSAAGGAAPALDDTAGNNIHILFFGERK